MDDRIKLAEGRFWSYVAKMGEDDCWLWIAGHFTQGYGSFHFEGKSLKASRFSWMLHFGPIPDDKFVLHDCDVPSCVNPKHLFLGTVIDNNRDREKKGRSHKQPKSFYRDMQKLTVAARKRNGTYVNGGRPL